MIRKPIDKAQTNEVLRRQQERLCLLRHASICHDNTEETTSSVVKCELPYCPEMKVLWKHICDCDNRVCEFNHCISSRYVLSHYKECKEASCEVCLPVRNAIEETEAKKIITAVTPKTIGVKREASLISTTNPTISPIRKVKQQDISYIDSLTADQLEQHILSLRFSRSGHIAPNSLKAHFLPLLKKLIDHQFGWVFSSPVDPIALDIPDYFNVIKCPMDLGSIRKRLEACTHYNCTESVAADIRLTFQNCIMFNDSANEFNLLARDMLQNFENDLKQLQADMDAELDAQFALQSQDMCQLCGGDSHKFAPSMLFCNGPCRGRIRRHTHYHGDMKSEFHWCSACFKDLKNPINVTNPVSGILVILDKDTLRKLKNSDVVEEPWVECDLCKKWFHQICALFNEQNNNSVADGEPFHCPSCLRNARITQDLQPSTEPLAAYRLPHTRLSLYLETRLLDAIKKQLACDAAKFGDVRLQMSTGIDYMGLTVREVLSVEKKTRMKDRMSKVYTSSEYPYRSRCFCVFQKIDAVDVLLFTLYVQEYGDACPEPNRKRIYISYLDSVNYFRPKTYRTLMHQEVIAGCLEDARRRGYIAAHIWSCPPLKGDDYIFFCKPENQKIPKAARLRQWYIKLLNVAQSQGSCSKISTLYAEYYQKMKPANCIPYFDGDYWPTLAEELAKQLEEESTKMKDGSLAVKIKKEVKKKAPCKKKTTTNGKESKGKAIKEEENERENPDPMMKKFKTIVQPQKDDFFVVYLQPLCTLCDVMIQSGGRYWALEPKEHIQNATILLPHKGPGGKYNVSNQPCWKGDFYCPKCYASRKPSLEKRVKVSEGELMIFPKLVPKPTLHMDADPIIPCDIFDTRESFITYCQSNHCQFDMIRRAKHSTMMILYHLFNQDCPITYCCSSCTCKLEEGNRWNCSTCLDYNLCDRCKVKTRHEHSLNPISCVTAQRKKAKLESSNGTITPGTARRQVDPSLLKLIEHASGCKKEECQQTCLRMRSLLQHGITCKAKVSGKCQTCRRILNLLKLHAQYCTNTNCHVPRCGDIRVHLARLVTQQEQMQDRRQTSLVQEAIQRQMQNNT